jgi:YfiH family protein
MSRVLTESTRRSRLLTECGVPHGFSTRLGGTSADAFTSLNFGNPGELPVGVARDPKGNIEENFRRTLVAAGCPRRRVIQVHQVHGSDVHVHPADTIGPAVVWGDVKADGIVTEDPRVVLAVRVADCCPVLLATADGRVVAAVHAGWRGVVSGVTVRAVKAIRERSGAEIVAAIGPCISFEQFEVGDEVAAEFRAAFGHAADVLVRPRGAQHPGKSLVDLKGALAVQLRAAGVHQIDIDPGCTVSEPELFFSHRRDAGVTGRMIGMIGPRG